MPKKMKKYDSYKDSGVEWIGEIPSHWTLKKLKFIGNLYSGLSGKSGSDFSAEPTSNTKPFINFTNVANNKYIVSDNFGNVRLDENENQNKVEKGDLLFLMSSENQEEVGKSALLNSDFGELYLNSFCKGLRISDSEIYPNFLNYLLNSSILSQIVSLEGRGFTRINLRMEGVQNLPILYPSLNEQTAIANYLDQKTTQIDDLIDKKERLIQLLEEERTAIINQAVTKGLDPTVPMKDSGIEWLGEIPEHWEVTKIKTVTIKIGSGVTPKGGAEIYESSGIPLLRSQNIYFDGFRLENVAYITREIHDSMKNSQVQSGDVLLNITGGSIGRCYFVKNEFKEANVNQHVCIVRPNERIITEFLYYVLSSTIGQHQIDLCQTGGNREALNFEHLKNFFLCLPKVDEQKNIVQRLKSSLNNFNLTIEKFRKEIELLKEYKTALISEVVTGKVKVFEGEFSV